MAKVFNVVLELWKFAKSGHTVHCYDDDHCHVEKNAKN